MNTRVRVRRSRLLLTGGAVTAALLWATAVTIVASLLIAWPWAVLPGAGAFAVTLWLRRAVFDLGRVALWLEEERPDLQFTLVTLLDRAAGPVQADLEAKVASIDFERNAYQALRRMIALPLGAVVVATAVGIATDAHRTGGPRNEAQGATSDDQQQGALHDAIGRVVALVTPPRHTGLPARRLQDPLRIEGVTGSRIRLEGEANRVEMHARIDSLPLAMESRAEGWQVHLTMPGTPAVIRIRRGVRERLVLLEPRPDSLPVVRLDLPMRDTVLGQARGTVPLAASFQDDFGLVESWWELIISRGDGENFEFRTLTLDRAPLGGARSSVRSLTLPIDSLSLTAGDVVLLRAVARDGNTSPGPGIAGSDPRTIRIAADRTEDSLDIEVLPPPEPLANLLSQRMLIVLTEALEAKQPRLPRSTVIAEATRIGRDQTSLRRQIGDLVFARLEDLGQSGEHSHDDGHDHSAMSPDELLRAAEAANRHAGNEVLDFAGGESPVIAVNRPLLEAYHAMWAAARELNLGEPKAALPHMYVALDAIQRARLADRIYLRGRTRPVVVDVAKVRLAGKRDGIAPSKRTPLPSVGPALGRVADRFDAALDLLTGNRNAAIDSLLLLRAELLTERPGLAPPLAEAIDTLRFGRDPTAALVRARRAIGSPPVISPGFRRWSRSP